MAELLYMNNKRSIEREKIKIKYIHEGLEIGNLRVSFSDSDDITINGRLIRKESTIPYEDIEVVADILNESRELLLSLHSYENFNFKDNPIESFNCFCAKIERFFDEEIATIEIYTRVKRSEIR